MKNNIFTKFVAISLVSSIFIFSIPNIAYSSSVGAIKQKLQYTKNKLEDKKQIVRQLKKQERETSSKLDVLQMKLEDTGVRLEDAKYKYTKTQEQINNTSSQLDISEKQLEKKIDNTIDRLKRIYKYRYTDLLLFAFNSDDVSTFIRRFVYFKYIIRKDNQEINEIKKQTNDIIHLKQTYVEKKYRIASISKQINTEKGLYEVQTKETESYLGEIKNKREVYERELSALQYESNKIAQTLRNLMIVNKRKHLPNIQYGKSSDIMWPISSRVISSYFGYRVHPIFRTNQFHSGLDLSSPSGVPIHAALGGVVISSGWQGGYGKCVVIDHGKGLATLYGHASALYVSAGQRVTKGTVIAAVGSTGFSTGSHLHFEVRVNGNPVNPLAYLR